MRMAREWQQTRFPEFVLPDAVYYQSVWAVRDLYRMKNRIIELDEEISSGKCPPGVVSDVTKGYPFHKPTEKAAVEKMLLENRVDAIDGALRTVPEIYRSPVMESIINRKNPTGSLSKIWKIWKQRFLFNVAKNLSLI